MEKLPLDLLDGSKLRIRKEKIQQEIDDLEISLEGHPFLNDINFSKKILFSHEIKNNNNIEGITDDIDTIQTAIESKRKIKDKDKRDRIVNLYLGYKFILEHSDINKESLRKLYRILSKGLLDKESLSDMGKYYRKRQGIILIKGRLDDSYHTTMDAKLVDDFMNRLLDYINSNNDMDTATEYFVKSQIAHFYFVYIHPYFDINGRTARTLSMWYLLNNKCYPYTIFNRAINYEFPKYDESIIEAKKYGDITYFIKHMLIGVKKELEKEFFMHDIDQSINSKLSTMDYQTLHYVISMKGLITLLDFARFYNRDNDKRSIKNIYDEMIEPLLDKGALEFVRYTTKCYDSTKKNFEFKINENLVNKDPRYIKYLK